MGIYDGWKMLKSLKLRIRVVSTEASDHFHLLFGAGHSLWVVPSGRHRLGNLFSNNWTCLWGHRFPLTAPKSMLLARKASVFWDCTCHWPKYWAHPSCWRAKILHRGVHAQITAGQSLFKTLRSWASSKQLVPRPVFLVSRIALVDGWIWC